MAVITPAATPALKRSRSDLEATTSSPTASPAVKRPRVQFKSENKIHTLQSWDDEKTLSLIREEVRSAIEKHVNGESTQYMALCDLLSQRPSSPEALPAKLLKRYMVAITGLCRLMDRKCNGLVSAITKISWLGRDLEFVRLYQTLLTNVITTYGGYTSPILSSLISTFTTMRPRYGRLPNEDKVSVPEMRNRVHMCLRHIIDKIPSAINQLHTELRQDFPHPSDSFDEHMDYVDNLLAVTKYAKQVKNDIVAMIFDKVTILDAQMQTDIEGLQEELEVGLGQDFEAQITSIIVHRQTGKALVEEDDDFSDSDDESEIDEFENPAQKRIHEAKQEVAKLDGLMNLLFNHYQMAFEPSRASMAEQLATFDQIFGMFSRMVLTTEKSRFVQFLLFYYAQKSPELSKHFVDHLIDILKDVNADKMVRRAAASYLASFISRGALVTPSLVKTTFYELGRELDKLRALHEQNERLIPDLSRYGPYYTIFQCLMYIFCFRWRDLLDEEVDDDDFDVHELVWSRDIADTFRRNIPSRLNPFKVCAQPIVTQFCIVVRQLEFIYFDHIVEQNKRVRLTRTMNAANGSFSILAESHNQDLAMQGESHLQLGAYFPFDPYRLPLSKRLIEDKYNIWRPVPGFSSSAINTDGDSEAGSEDEGYGDSVDSDEDESEEEESDDEESDDEE